eukprot:CAMPEP_0169073776 /NCGR_PEP_ID=MMETSP1015-20121227/6922_1 /TAXON_ID=342587 /ORGANISM="Karlodinium micrum, Strain CCMP2283" /LENGTH=289 /DNA_ID=CAMNT_0009133049 /DNA_START=211 /DNA_END=1077 /DNA_ORIENTATION=-
MQDVAQCGLYRQPHHDKVAPKELSNEAKTLLNELSAAKGDKEYEWRSNAHLAEIADALDLRGDDDGCRVVAANEALLGFRELLKKTEKGTITEERCTAYELELSGVPGHLLRFLKHHATVDSLDPFRQPSLNNDRWSYFREAFSEQTKQTRKGLGRLVKALHAVIETGEVFPVWRHKRERGLRAVTEALQLKLQHVDDGRKGLAPFLPQSMQSQMSLMVEPLVPLSELSRYLLRANPTTDMDYLRYCRDIVGTTLLEQGSGERFSILSFEILFSALALPIHTIQKEGSD